VVAHPDAPHTPPVVALTVRQSWSVCYGCAAAIPSESKLAKKRKTAIGGILACCNKDSLPAALQTRQHGRKMRLFTVVCCRVPSPVAPSMAPRGAPAPSLMKMPLDVFLRRGSGSQCGGALGGGARLQTTETTVAAQSGALL